MLVTDSLLAYTLAATLLTLTPCLDTALILRTATAEGDANLACRVRHRSQVLYLGRAGGLWFRCATGGF